MNRNNTPEKEPEMLLKEKMEELSSSVDCFDNISSRAFPKDNLDFSESGFVVSDLENITGKHDRLNVLKWIAVTAAAAVAIAFIPKTSAFRSFMSSLSSNSSRQFYQMAASEITAIADDPDYLIYDVPLSYYAENDILVTPLMSCPFADSDNEDIKVRVFIRTISGIPTNQVSAVEYTGSFNSSGFIAAAQSAYRFSDDDIEKAQSLTFTSNEEQVLEAVESNFSTVNGSLADYSGTAVSLASFTQYCFVKDDSGISACTVDVVYGHDKVKYNGDGCFYDILYSKDGSVSPLPERSSWWEAAVRPSGINAQPKHSESIYVQTDIFGSEHSPAGDTGWGFLQPYSGADGITATDAVSPFDPEEILRSYVWIITNQGSISEIMPPVDRSSALNMKLYFPPYRFESAISGYSVYKSDELLGIKVMSNKSSLNEDFPIDSLHISPAFYNSLLEDSQQLIDNFSSSEYDAEREAFAEEERRAEELRKKAEEAAKEMEERQKDAEEAQKVYQQQIQQEEMTTK